eukprot:gb/GFBE01021505.1/.p1 GENE.gb/GFBE01021505.1/~~gb/GFBE01021505.1/.p1  ORF type:complete len:197 (+),score=30.20 gb/GFBE01021505.1/:1-591(+)
MSQTDCQVYVSFRARNGKKFQMFIPMRTPDVQLQFLDQLHAGVAPVMQEADTDAKQQQVVDCLAGISQMRETMLKSTFHDGKEDLSLPAFKLSEKSNEDHDAETKQGNPSTPQRGHPGGRLGNMQGQHRTGGQHDDAQVPSTVPTPPARSRSTQSGSKAASSSSWLPRIRRSWKANKADAADAAQNFSAIQPGPVP